MAHITDSLHNIRLLDDLARRNNSVNNIHPLAKLLTTVIYLTVVVSFGRYEILALLPLLVYPIVIFSLADLPLGQMLKRIAWVMPFVIGIGLFNPVFDHYTVNFLGISISRGWLTFLSIFLKCILTVTAGLILVATTGIDRLGAALRMIRVPRILVLQLLLTCRYISVLGDELARMLRAYSLRAPGHKGISRDAWGSFTGSLLLRSFDRAQRIYSAMCLRGFAGDYHTGNIPKAGCRDMSFLVGWGLFFVIIRFFNFPLLLGSFLTGVINL